MDGRGGTNARAREERVELELELELERVVARRREMMNARRSRSPSGRGWGVCNASTNCLRTRDTTDTTVSRVTIGGGWVVWTRGLCLE